MVKVFRWNLLLLVEGKIVDSVRVSEGYSSTYS
jgi:hypothetical protein